MPAKRTREEPCVLFDDKKGKIRLQQTNLAKLQNKGKQDRADHDTRMMRQLLMYRGSEECKKASGVNVCKLMHVRNNSCVNICVCDGCV